jgi:ubiquinone/menaquinone biosynthesis C-methylase UbiE
MNKKLLGNYKCPLTKERLHLVNEKFKSDQNIISGLFESETGNSYNIIEGIPDFTYPEELKGSDAKFRKEYDRMANDIYDNSMDWLFDLFYEDEEKVRTDMIDLLELKDDFRVLEIGCGTGRDSVHIAKRVRKGSFFAQDLSIEMLKKCRDRFAADSSSEDQDIEFFLGNASYLPFEDNYFDAVFHFGGLNEFTEGKLALEEISRVVKTGGKVVLGDESMAPWLRDHEYGKVLLNNNSLWEHNIPLEILPENALNVTLRWILGNSFYVIDYVSGEGLPAVNLDLPHKGPRGGTCRTRYYGNLEGVNLETKQLAQEAAKDSGLSLHEWLDNVVSKAAKKC